MDYSNRKGDLEMKESTQKTSHKPVLHGFLLNNGKFITPTEMVIMESLGVVQATKTELHE
jgi:hypothetical protein